MAHFTRRETGGGMVVPMCFSFSGMLTLPVCVYVCVCVHLIAEEMTSQYVCACTGVTC